MSDSLWPHGLQHTRLPCPSLSPRVCSNSCPLSPWWDPTTSSFVAPFSSCPQSFPALGSFQWVSSLHQVAKLQELQLQHQSFQWIFRVEKYYKPITAPYYITKCVSWVPRLTLLDFTNKLDLWTHSQNGTRMYDGNLLYRALVSSSMKWGEKYHQ